MVDPSDPKPLLRRIPAFADLADPVLDALIAALQPRAAPTGTVVCRQGDPGDTLYLVLHGMLRVEFAEPGGETAVLGNIRPGEFLGEMALLDKSPRSATVTAASDCQLLVLDAAGLTALETRSPAASVALLYAITATVTRRIRQVQAHLDELAARGDDLDAAPSAAMEGGDTVFGWLWARMTGVFDAPRNPAPTNGGQP